MANGSLTAPPLAPIPRALSPTTGALRTPAPWENAIAGVINFAAPFAMGIDPGRAALIGLGNASQQYQLQKQTDRETLQAAIDAEHQRGMAMAEARQTDFENQLKIREDARKELETEDKISGGGTFEGTGIEAQMLNKYLANKDRPGWLDSPEGRLVTQRLTRETTIPTPTGTMIRPGYNLDALGSPVQQVAEGPSGFVAKPPTEGERRTEYAAGSMINLEARLDQVMADNPEFDPTSIGEMRGQIPGVGNIVASPGYRQQRAVADEFATNLVFLRSGATAREEEKASAFQNMFPQPGDDAATVELKRNLRLDQMEEALLQASQAGRIRLEDAMEEIEKIRAARSKGYSGTIERTEMTPPPGFNLD